MNVTQSAVGDKRGLWTTVLGAAILIGEGRLDGFAKSSPGGSR